MTINLPPNNQSLRRSTTPKRPRYRQTTNSWPSSQATGSITQTIPKTLIKILMCTQRDFLCSIMIKNIPAVNNSSKKDTQRPLKLASVLKCGCTFSQNKQKGSQNGILCQMAQKISEMITIYQTGHPTKRIIVHCIPRSQA